MAEVRGMGISHDNSGHAVDSMCSVESICPTRRHKPVAALKSPAPLRLVDLVHRLHFHRFLLSAAGVDMDTSNAELYFFFVEFMSFWV